MIVQLKQDSPSVNLALPPVGWHRTVAQDPHWTTVEAWEKTVLRVSIQCSCNDRSSSLTTEQLHVRDLETSWALDIHEERVGLGHNLLELVGSGLNLSGSV
jgi:hypothetical protein